MLITHTHTTTITSNGTNHTKNQTAFILRVQPETHRPRYPHSSAHIHFSLSPVMVCVCLSAYWWSSCYSHRGLIVNNARLITKTLVRGFNVQSQTETKGGIGQRKSKGGSGGEVKLGEEEKRKRKRRLGSERWPSSALSRLQYWSTLSTQGSTCWVRGGGAQEGRSMQAEVQKRWKRCAVCVCVCVRVCVWLAHHQAVLTDCHPLVTLSK